MVQLFAQLRQEKRFGECVDLFSDDGKWHTLYGNTIIGKQELKDWMEREHKDGRQNLIEGEWVSEGQDFKRELKVLFPNGGTHTVFQTLKFSNGKIAEVVVKPKFEAHVVVLQFAEARNKNDDEAALALMSDEVTWITYENYRVQGKHRVRELLLDMKKINENRQGLSDFEKRDENVLEHDGRFERTVLIEQPDGEKTRSTQTIVVQDLKIVTINVVSKEHMIKGKWAEVTAQESGRRKMPTIASTNEDQPQCKACCTAM